MKPKRKTANRRLAEKDRCETFIGGGKKCGKLATHGVFKKTSTTVGKYACTKHATEFRRSGFYVIKLA